MPMRTVALPRTLTLRLPWAVLLATWAMCGPLGDAPARLQAQDAAKDKSQPQPKPQPKPMEKRFAQMRQPMEQRLAQMRKAYEAKEARKRREEAAAEELRRQRLRHAGVRFKTYAA